VDIKRGVCISKNNNYSNGAQAGGSGMGLGMFSNPNCSCLKCKRAKTGEMDGNEPILSMILVFYQGLILFNISIFEYCCSIEDPN
jgi:hypothetical protein